MGSGNHHPTTAPLPALWKIRSRSSGSGGVHHCMPEDHALLASRVTHLLCLSVMSKWWLDIHMEVLDFNRFSGCYLSLALGAWFLEIWSSPVRIPNNPGSSLSLSSSHPSHTCINTVFRIPLPTTAYICHSMLVPFFCLFFMTVQSLYFYTEVSSLHTGHSAHSAVINRHFLVRETSFLNSLFKCFSTCNVCAGIYLLYTFENAGHI